MVVHLDSEREARLLGSRSISVKHIWAYWADGASYEDLHAQMKLLPELYVRPPRARARPQSR